MPKRILNSSLLRHPKWRSLGFGARLLYLCLIGDPESNLAGILYDAPQVWADTTGLPVSKVEAAAKELVGVGWLVRDGGWVWIPTYTEHQAKSPSTYASAASALDGCYSAVVLQGFRDRYPDISKMADDRVWRRIEQGVPPQSPPRVAPHPSDPDPDPDLLKRGDARGEISQRVFDHWVAVMGKDPKRAKFTQKRKRLVEALLKEGYTEDQILDGINGCKRSPYHQGDNDQKQHYDSLELICRDGGHLEKFWDTKGKKEKWAW